MGCVVLSKGNRGLEPTKMERPSTKPSALVACSKIENVEKRNKMGKV